MNRYTATIKHDTGKYKITTDAENQEKAIELICKAENCPACAIIKLTEKELFYKVVKIFRVSGRRQVLQRGLTLDQAQSLVKSYPSSKNSMVSFFKQ